MYEYYKKITIDNTKVYGSSNHSNFPVLFKTTDNWLKTRSNGGSLRNSSGYDLVFRNSLYGPNLSHEIQRYNASTGEMIAWIKIPTLKYNEDTELYAVYGNSEISSSQENVSDVWSNNYEAVWQLKESGNGTGSEFIDSSGNNIHGTGGNGSASNTPTRTEGNIGYCQSFDGGDYITMGNVLSHGYGSTVSHALWIKTTDTSTQMMGKAVWATDQGEWVWILGNGTVGYYLYSFYVIFTYEKAKYSSLALNDNGWHLIQMTYNGNSNPSGMNLYADGNLLAVGGTVNDATTGNVENSNPFNIGSVNNGAGGNYNGLISLPRVSNTVRSLEWHQTEYANQNSPSTFYSVGRREYFNNVNMGCNF